MAAIATFALKAGVWFRRGRLLIVSPDSLGTACPLSGRNSTYRPVQILEASSIPRTTSTSKMPRTATTNASRARWCLRFVPRKVLRDSIPKKPALRLGGSWEGSFRKGHGEMGGRNRYGVSRRKAALFYQLLSGYQ